MLLDLDFHRVILGHFERCILFDKSTDIVGRKFGFACLKGLNVIACFGKNLKQYSKENTISKLEAQYITSRAEKSIIIIITYEPFWTIGTSKLPLQLILRVAHEHVSEQIEQSMRIVKKGSVDGGNFRELATLPNVKVFLSNHNSSWSLNS